MDFCYEAILVGIASSGSRWLRSPRVSYWRSRFTGAVLIGLGVILVLTGQK
jgi:threonine/homoserine/homoserine lactone efflux protein